MLVVQLKESKMTQYVDAATAMTIRSLDQIKDTAKYEKDYRSTVLKTVLGTTLVALGFVYTHTLAAQLSSMTDGITRVLYGIIAGNVMAILIDIGSIWRYVRMVSDGELLEKKEGSRVNSFKYFYEGPMMIRFIAVYLFSVTLAASILYSPTSFYLTKPV